MKLLILLLSLVANISVFATTIPQNNVPTTDDAFALDRFMGPVALAHLLGGHLYRSHTTAFGYWDFATQGGAIGTSDVGIHFPANTIIRNVLFDVVTTVTTSASGTLAFTAVSSGDLKAALAAASWTGRVAGIPVGTAATAVKCTSACNLLAAIATGALTAGSVRIFVDYVVSGPVPVPAH